MISIGAATTRQFAVVVILASLAVALLAGAATVVASAADARTIDCAAAAAIAETENDLPKGLLASIGLVESADHAFAIDVDGRGSFPGTASDAVRQAQQALAAGARFVDVGCFQVDLFWHAGLFASLRDAFDPLANARAAAAVFAAFRRQTSSLQDAIARYHSGQSMEGRSYAARVVDRWRGVPFAAADIPASRAPVLYFGMAVVTPGSGRMRSAGLPRVFVP